MERMQLSAKGLEYYRRFQPNDVPGNVYTGPLPPRGYRVVEFNYDGDRVYGIFTNLAEAQIALAAANKPAHEKSGYYSDPYQIEVVWLHATAESARQADEMIYPDPDSADDPNGLWEPVA